MRLLKLNSDLRVRHWLPHLVMDSNFEEFRIMLEYTRDIISNELFRIEGTKLYKHIGALEMLKELLEYTDRNNISHITQAGGKE